ncbi:hypothetical protein EYZ11_008108 [Aspergillus tanneri]|uniref:Amine oxidase domain-containing protein n=1 Tax=Aspergillus tanneri TaxID=1220188 RepID=A0A4S3JDH5_9EURO|nr:uncharacterized protein ATNIH1004_009222 [Aspergillus tanneri]KAA8645011.1 hypothetical protein ATNIH1004_009222 [Aspergillus tanneri]THC92418.1 hypothetical protein EYZ11_008108 [Aspergillus tanneri]
MNLLIAFSLYMSLAHCTSQPEQVKDTFEPSHYNREDVITRDIVVIGGGASGTYAAINLRRLGQRVVLVEKEALLGGHTRTYTNPATGNTIDYGAQAFWNTSVTRDYLAYLDVPVTQYTGVQLTDMYADFQTGEQVIVHSSRDFTAYIEQLRKYPYLKYSWDLPYPVPPDLLSPFSEFVAKYNLNDIGYNIYYGSQGLSNILDQPTVNVFKEFHESLTDAVKGGNVKGHPNNGEIYTKALAYLGKDILFSSRVIAAYRPESSTGVKLVVQTPSACKLILASKLLVSIPPLLDNMEPFDLTKRESNLFSRWEYSAYYVMLVSNTGLPSGYRFRNANAWTTSNIPELPAPYQVTETNVPGIFRVWYGSPYPLEEAVVKADVTSIIRRLQSLMHANATTVPRFLAFNSHTPFELVVQSEEISKYFYRDLNALQGYRNTWYTGAAVSSYNSATVWNFTAALLPSVIAA